MKKKVFFLIYFTSLYFIDVTGSIGYELGECTKIWGTTVATGISITTASSIGYAVLSMKDNISKEERVKKILSAGFLTLFSTMVYPPVGVVNIFLARAGNLPKLGYKDLAIPFAISLATTHLAIKLGFVAETERVNTTKNGRYILPWIGCAAGTVGYSAYILKTRYDRI